MSLLLEICIYLCVSLVMVALVVLAIKSSKTGGSGGSGGTTMVLLGATDALMNEEKRKSAEVIVELNAGKKLEEQSSGDPKDKDGGDIT